MNYLQRKRLILMRAGQFKGYLRTASGGVPLALAKCMNDYPVSVEVSGKTTQSGTPAPDTPAEIVSLGERALISGTYQSGTTVGITFTANNNESVSISGTSTGANGKTFFKFNVAPNTSYSFKLSIKGEYSIIYAYDTTNKKTLKNYGKATDGTVYTFTTTDTTEVACLAMHFPEDTTVDCEISAEVWEPQREYKIPTTYRGANLFDVNDKKSFSDGVTVSDEGWITVSVDNTTGSSIKYTNVMTKVSKLLKPSTYYLAVLEVKEYSGENNIGLISNWEAGNGLSQFTSGATAKNAGTHVFKRCTRDSFDDCTYYLRTQIGCSAGKTFHAVFRISVIEDTSVTAETFEYEPFREPVTHNIYLPEQINGINGLADTVKLDVENKTAELNKQFGVEVFDGSESWSIQSVNEYGITNFRCTLSDKTPENSKDVICSHYQTQTTGIADTQTEGVMVTNGVCYVRSTQYSTVDEFKSWLTEQYEAGTPLTPVYRLKTPAITDISSLQDWDIPKLHSGTNVITSETEPSNMAVTYYSTVKESETS